MNKLQEFTDHMDIAISILRESYTPSILRERILAKLEEDKALGESLFIDRGYEVPAAGMMGKMS